MLDYTWCLSYLQPENNIPLNRIQEILACSGIYIDYSIKNGMAYLTIFVSDEAGGGCQAAPSPKRGRPACAPANNLTYEKVMEMRSSGYTADEIAKELGVSRRTYYRKLKSFHDKGSLADDISFSEW